MWLTRVHLVQGGEKVSLSGMTVEAAHVPVYLQNLKPTLRLQERALRYRGGTAPGERIHPIAAIWRRLERQWRSRPK